MSLLKKLLLPFLCLLLALTAPFASAAELLRQSDIFYVNDSANILSDETTDYICQENARLYEQCEGSEVVVVTVDFLGGLNSEEYAYTLYNDWGIGGEESSGVLILLSPGEEKYWIAVGDGLSGTLTAGRLETILADNMEEDFDAENYDEAALNTFKAVVSEVDDYYGVSSSMAEHYYSQNSNQGSYTQGYEQPVENSGSMLFSLMLNIIVICVLITVVCVLVSRFRPLFRPTFTPRGRYRRTMMPPPPPRRREPPPFDAPPPRRSGGFFGGFGSFGGSGSSHRSSGHSSFGGGHSGFGGRSGGGRIGGGGGHSRGGGAGRR